MEIDSRGGFLVSQIKQIQGRVFEKLLKKAGIHDLNGAQGRILFVLWQRDNLPIVKLSEETGLAKTTLTGMLDRMEKLELVRRSYNPEDRRQIRIGLTGKARGMHEDYTRVSQEMNELFYEGFRKEEIEQFEGFLSRILVNLKESGKRI